MQIKKVRPKSRVVYREATWGKTCEFLVPFDNSLYFSGWSHSGSGGLPDLKRGIGRGDSEEHYSQRRDEKRLSCRGFGEAGEQDKQGARKNKVSGK